MNLTFPRIVGIVLSLSLFGCSGVWESNYAMFEYLLATPDDETLTNEELAQRPVPAMYIRRDDRGQFVLDFSGTIAGVDYWRAKGNGMVALHESRLVRALGFELSLQSVQGVGYRPLPVVTIATPVGSAFSWLSDWAVPEYQGQLSHSEITAKNPAELTLQGQVVRTMQLQETVTFADGSQFINQYWFDAQSGKLLRTIQKPAGFWHQLDMIFISRIELPSLAADALSTSGVTP